MCELYFFPMALRLILCLPLCMKVTQQSQRVLVALLAFLNLLSLHALSPDHGSGQKNKKQKTNPGPRAQISP